MEVVYSGGGMRSSGQAFALLRMTEFLIGQRRTADEASPSLRSVRFARDDKSIAMAVESKRDPSHKRRAQDDGRENSSNWRMTDGLVAVDRP